MTRYLKLLKLRREAVNAPGDQGPRIRRIDRLIYKERASHRYTGVKPIGGK